MSFTPLHVHTEHSSLDGLARIKDIPHAAKAHGFTACALTDHGTPGGLWSFARECQKLGIKPIPGIEAYLAIGSRHEPQTMRVIADDGMGDADEEFDDEGDTRTKEKKYYHLTVLARNRTGWHNLIRFHNETQQTKKGKYPLGDWELLKKYGEGLILLTGCLASPVAGPLAQTQFYDEDSQEYSDLIEDAHTAVDHMIEAVGAEHVFVEIMDHGIESEIYAMDKLFGLAEDRGLSVVATNDSHYMDCDDHDAHSAFLAVGTGKSLHDEGRFQFNGSGYHFKSEDEMRQIAPDDQDWQDAVENTALVAELIEDDTVPEPEIRLPTFALTEGWTSADDYLRHLVEEGAKWRYGADWNQDDEIVQRVDHELSVVSDMGYSDYFLITWDIINYAQENNITTGPGRGSAAGAILAYTLGITDLCPLRYGLLFERFLERGRVGMPDIDMDFPKHKRHLIHRYCVEKYGYDHVAHIGGFNKAQTKAAIKDAARVHAPQIPKKMSAGRERDELEVQRKKVFRLGDTLAKTIEYGDNKSQPFDRLDDPTSDDEMLRAQEFWAAVEEAGELGEDIVALARRFEGVSKNESIHPCGFVISTEPLFDIVPLRRESKDATEDDPLVIVWDGEMVEDFGLLKMDFLGIQNLDYIDLTFDYLALRGEDGLPQSITDIPDPDGDAEGNLSDEVWAAYDMLAAGRTAGCFQLDGPGMTRVVQDIRPESLNDLSAAVALYRPGPISARMPEDYAAKKHGRLPESYERLTDDQHEIEWLDQVLGETFQNVVYQEQSMRLGQVVAGFDDNQRSTLRKAIGKKKQDLMDKAQGWWFDGSGKEFTNGDEIISPVFSEQTAENVWEFIKGSADYAFNKCITGDTLLSTEQKNESWTVEMLYRRLHGSADAPKGMCPFCWERPARPVRPVSPCPRCASWLTKFNDGRGFGLLAADSTDGRIRPQLVKDVHHNGVRQVYRVTLSDGRSVRATSNHRFLASDGAYVHVSEMIPGTTALSTHGGYEHQSYDPDAIRTTCGPRIFRKGTRWYAPKAANTAFIDGGHSKLREWTLTTWNSAACDECGLSRDEARLERAHLDGDRRNNEPENLAWKCVSHHKRWDYSRNGRRRRWEKGHLMSEATVVSVEPDGIEDVYDVEMAPGTDHNFIANGIVSHNSHSAAYGVLAYWTAYLKANFPVEYGAAMLATSDNDDKRLLVLADLKDEGIEIVPPAINVSAQHTAPAEGRIMLGLGEIKDVGKAAGDIITTRDAEGEFSSLHEVATRVKGLTVTALRALIDAGAMDQLGPRRGLLKILYAAKKADIAPVGEDFGTVERDRRQRTVLGTVVGSTTLDHVDLADVQDQIGETGEDHLVIDRLDDLDSASSSVSHIGVVGDFERRVSRTGPMGKAVIEDSSSINLVIFADAYKQMGGDRDKPEPGDLLVVRGKAKTSTYGNDEEGEGRREILASRVWKIADPTLVEDQPVETSLLVDALEESGGGDEEGDDPDGESPDGEDDGELEPAADEGEKVEAVPEESAADDESEEAPDDAGPGWLVAIVTDSIDGLWVGRSPILYMEGEPRNHPAASVGESSPVYLDRRGRIAAKLYGGGDLQAEVAELKASAGV